MASFFDHHCGVRYPLPPLLSTLFSPTCLPLPVTPHVAMARKFF
jgi:hypothetical protein